MSAASAARADEVTSPTSLAGGGVGGRLPRAAFLRTETPRLRRIATMRQRRAPGRVAPSARSRRRAPRAARARRSGRPRCPCWGTARLLVEDRLVVEQPAGDAVEARRARLAASLASPCAVRLGSPPPRRIRSPLHDAVDERPSRPGGSRTARRGRSVASAVAVVKSFMFEASRSAPAAPPANRVCAGHRIADPGAARAAAAPQLARAGPAQARGGDRGAPAGAPRATGVSIGAVGRRAGAGRRGGTAARRREQQAQAPARRGCGARWVIRACKNKRGGAG